jgi:hypothetical protein
MLNFFSGGRVGSATGFDKTWSSEFIESNELVYAIRCFL